VPTVPDAALILCSKTYKLRLCLRACAIPGTGMRYYYIFLNENENEIWVFTLILIL
jgi:hypothetical protein